MKELIEVMDEVGKVIEGDGIESLLGFIVGTVFKTISECSEHDDFEPIERFKALTEKAMEAVSFIKENDMPEEEWENIFSEEETDYMLKVFKSFIKGVKSND